MTINNFKMRFATAEDLIILKIIAERNKDWLDVEGLTKMQYPNLDFGYIRGWLAEFAEWLEQPELIQRFERIVANARLLYDAD